MANKATDIIPHLTGGTTDATLINQGYTYNQAGLTYNQTGVQYGGIQNTDADIYPMIAQAFSPAPSIYGYSDIYSSTMPEPSKGRNAPGWFMFINMD